jgi:folate-dependent phosphoribosylglycinamide formyltransferase PurN
MTSEDDDIDNLIERIHRLEHELYPEIIKYICDNQINIYSNEVIFKNLSIKGTHIYKKYDI